MQGIRLRSRPPRTQCRVVQRTGVREVLVDWHRVHLVDLVPPLPWKGAPTLQPIIGANKSVRQSLELIMCEHERFEVCAHSGIKGYDKI